MITFAGTLYTSYFFKDTKSEVKWVKFQLQKLLTRRLIVLTVADIRNFSKAVPDTMDVEFLSDQKSGVGTRFKETREINGREASTELEVTEYEENDHVRIVSDSHGTIWDSLFSVKKANGNTELTLVMNAKAYKFLPKLLNPIMKFFIKKEISKDMDAVKVYCEQ